MTPEEAIRVLERMLDEFCNEDAWVQECKDAVDMAIEALKAQSKHDQNTSQKQPDVETFGVKTGETCEDAISRRDAIDAIKTSRYLVDAMEKIIRLPSVQPEQRWIPCSERLPENDERVLATTAWGEVTIAERIYPPIDDTCWFIHDGNTNATIDDVVAWMPLIEPYEGGIDG